ncbi:MAG: hypothetical protein CME64_15975 [Halobacteriovoraceae bacterium]|nr:hypothetical protein [Halobacteriovoraceae bacterium]|tara:strand:+ start:11820 stop:12410 length:591 start_codon:yes stop_codon:yes gene_type:complete
MVYICDFDDSFTYNIYSEISLSGLKATVISKNSIKEFLETNINTKGKLAIVLGPGPFHPDDYPEIVTAVKKILTRKDLFLMGICLGHQLIARALGYEVDRSINPKHGEVEKIGLDIKARKLLGTSESQVFVQRYNSLGVKAKDKEFLKSNDIDAFVNNKEIFMLSGKGLISYQFHPESVGTSFRSRFFRPLKTFLL